MRSLLIKSLNSTCILMFTMIIEQKYQFFQQQHLHLTVVDFYIYKIQSHHLLVQVVSCRTMASQFEHNIHYYVASSTTITIPQRVRYIVSTNISFSHITRLTVVVIT